MRNKTKHWVISAEWMLTHIMHGLWLSNYDNGFENIMMQSLVGMCYMYNIGTDVESLLTQDAVRWARHPGTILSQS